MDLSSLLLRESGYERHDAGGYIAILGVSVQGGAFSMLACRWDVYERGILGRDPDAEAISILVLEEVMSTPVHQMTADLFDLVKRARGRLSGQPGCVATATAIDLGGGEGYLLGDAIRTEIEATFPLRTVTDHDLPAPRWDPTHRAFKMSGEAMIGALAARASARQVLISDDATVSARRILTDALRQASDVSSAPPLTRLIAWCSEIVGRPLMQPLVDTSRDVRTRVSPERMRIVR